jgi:parallel beta-helix repeat protein
MNTLQRRNHLIIFGLLVTGIVLVGCNNANSAPAEEPTVPAIHLVQTPVKQTALPAPTEEVTPTSTSVSNNIPVMVSPDHEHYVSSNGDDGEENKLAPKNKPWKTIQHAVDMAQAGDVIYIRSGQYDESVKIFNVKGNESAPITFQAYPGETVIINSPDWVGIQFKTSSWIILDGVNVTGASKDGIYLSDTNHVTVQNCSSFKNGGVGIHISSYDGSASNNSVIGCEVHDNKQEGIYLDVKIANPVPVDNNKVVGNKVYNNGYEGIQNTNEKGRLPKPKGTLIQANQVENNGKGGWAAFDLAGDNLLVEKNIVTNIHAEAGGIYYAGGDGTQIIDNEIHNEFLSFAQGEGIVINDATNVTVEGNRTFSSLGTSETGVSQIGKNVNVILNDNIKIAE